MNWRQFRRGLFGRPRHCQNCLNVDRQVGMLTQRVFELELRTGIDAGRNDEDRATLRRLQQLSPSELSEELRKMAIESPGPMFHLPQQNG